MRCGLTRSRRRQAAAPVCADKADSARSAAKSKEELMGHETCDVRVGMRSNKAETGL